MAVRARASDSLGHQEPGDWTELEQARHEVTAFCGAVAEADQGSQHIQDLKGGLNFWKSVGLPPGDSLFLAA